MTEETRIELSSDTTPVEVEPAEATAPQFKPAYRVRKSDEVIHIHVDLPGVAQEDLEVELQGRVLTVRGRIKSGPTDEGFRPLTNEFELGDYEAEFHVPDDVQPEGIEAELENGVLGLSLTRSSPGRRVIPVIQA